MEISIKIPAYEKIQIVEKSLSNELDDLEELVYGYYMV